MSENFNDKASNKPLAANQNVKWYKLGGKSKDAILRSIELNNQSDVDKKEIDDLAGTLGLKFLVARTDTYYGYSAHAPEIFASPYPNEEEFYMMCPVGDGRKDGETHFVPEDATELSKDEQELLEQGLFSAWAGALPIIHKEPIPLQYPNNLNEPTND